ncbi:MAG: diadenosine tetraphosphate hydrolase [Phycisphaerae bacterium]|nr:diadenosine tetraphosphate hydrolase [Phycisphaerae bacterium]|tara:strand:+ start:144 stop:554 length:411 start_codon:yes stop_codon:yes gene_type:complete
MSDTVFSKIVRGEIPAQKLYEDDHVIAILDVGPLSKGHTLVIPKEPAETMADLSDPAAAALGRVLPRIARALKKATGAESYNILQNNGESAGQSVMHVHVHVIPRFDDEGLAMDWQAKNADSGELEELGRKIARLL